MFALRTVAARSNQVCKPVVLNQLRAFAVGTPSSEDELTNLLKTDKDKLTVIDWYASWCGPCKIFAPVFSKLSDQFPDVSFLKVDIDEVDPTTMEGFPEVNAVPCFFLVKDGSVVRSFSGASEPQLVEAIKEHM